MQVQEKLYVSADEFFQKLGDSVAYDITNSTGKKIRAKQITKGYSYTKTLKGKVSRKGSVKVTIAEFEAPVKYVAEFQSSQGVNYVSYVIEQLDDEHIGVTYSEDFKGASAMKSANFKVMSFFYNRGAKKKATRLLRSIEAYIVEEHKKRAEANETE